ncbi:uncharacterized protein B0I36DRAFT_389670 [Microdochium trichocladiopsis]|uniref:Uncharacterized protein n=1 Tax=Microdochium trichocladiopsis TaxID=1682393 RepID=A0A9P8XQG3_9PEZI|nr:uncharacterized protein B0I36DRAFT_389670 [Microdochium trichocladiopsis]KAH7012068.1 hypothetical protein B0I36DRAFT_389670 [Microdochium trichocladiopsis]
MMEPQAPAPDYSAAAKRFGLFPPSKLKLTRPRKSSQDAYVTAKRDAERLSRQDEVTESAQRLLNAIMLHHGGITTWLLFHRVQSACATESFHLTNKAECKADIECQLQASTRDQIAFARALKDHIKSNRDLSIRLANSGKSYYQNRKSKKQKNPDTSAGVERPTEANVHDDTESLIDSPNHRANGGETEVDSDMGTGSCSDGGGVGEDASESDTNSEIDRSTTNGPMPTNNFGKPTMKKASELLKGLLQEAIRRIPSSNNDGTYLAAWSLHFPQSEERGYFCCISSLEMAGIKALEVFHLLFGVTVEDEDGVRGAVIPTGVKMIPQPKTLYTCCDYTLLEKVFAGDLLDAVTQSPGYKDEREQCLPKTMTVSATLSNNPSDPLVLNSTFDLLAGLRLKERLWGTD